MYYLTIQAWTKTSSVFMNNNNHYYVFGCRTSEHKISGMQSQNTVGQSKCTINCHRTYCVVVVINMIPTLSTTKFLDFRYFFHDLGLSVPAIVRTLSRQTKAIVHQSDTVSQKCLPYMQICRSSTAFEYVRPTVFRLMHLWNTLSLRAASFQVQCHFPASTPAL